MNMSLEQANSYFIEKLSNIKRFKEKFSCFNITDVNYYLNSNEIGASFDIYDENFINYMKDKSSPQPYFQDNSNGNVFLVIKYFYDDTEFTSSKYIPCLDATHNTNKSIQNSIINVYDFISEIKKTPFSYLSNMIFDIFIKDYYFDECLNFSNAKIPQNIKNKLILT